MTYPADPTRSLPDPDDRPEFYSHVAKKRLMAWGLDIIAITLLTLLLVILTAGIGFFFWPFLYLIVDFIYRIWSLASRSATPGMRVMAIEFRERDGQRLDGGTALLHTIGYYVSWGFPLIQMVSVGFIAMSARRQSLTDMIFGTAAINRPA